MHFSLFDLFDSFDHDAGNYTAGYDPDHASSIEHPDSDSLWFGPRPAVEIADEHAPHDMVGEGSLPVGLLCGHHGPMSCGHGRRDGSWPW